MSKVESKSKRDQIIALTELSKIYTLLGNTEKARRCLIEARQLGGDDAMVQT